VKPARGIVWEHRPYREEDDDSPNPFQKKSSLFGVSHGNPWLVSLPIFWATGGKGATLLPESEN
jgi:hypothetical protein